MVRKLKHHEAKLLKKVDFLQWKHDSTIREIQVMRRYHIQNREDYSRYNTVCGSIRKIVAELAKLDDQMEAKRLMSEKLVQKLHLMGVIPHEKLTDCDKVTVSAFCRDFARHRRRLAVVMVRLKMAETVKEAVTFIEQGHVRVGPEPVNDPAFLVTRHMEDFVTWVDTSKIRRKILKYNDKLDDYDLLT